MSPRRGGCSVPASFNRLPSFGLCNTFLFGRCGGSIRSAMDSIRVPKPLKTGYVQAQDGIQLYYRIYGPPDSKGSSDSLLGRSAHVIIICQSEVAIIVFFICFVGFIRTTVTFHLQESFCFFAESPSNTVFAVPLCLPSTIPSLQS